MASVKIVVLDGHTLNPGDLSWDALGALGELRVWDRTPPEETLARASGAEVLLTNKTRLGRAAIERLPELRFISVLASGFDVVDVEAARERSIPVSNVPAYGTSSVAQTAFAHILEWTQSVARHAASVRAGGWGRSGEFSYHEEPLVELAGRVLGIVGFGRIGRRTAEIARALGMRVLACDPGPVELPDWVRAVDLDSLFREADVVSLHCPLAPGAERIVDRRRLALMKRGAFLVNTSRGGLVDEEALAESLRSGRIGGAGLDVLSVEPPPDDHPLLSAPRVRVTPHLAWATREARARLLETTVANVRAFLAGRPRNVVSG